ncbi:MAG TPA: PAS domain-containing sensor histidine kinase [Thermoanaerobaculia bacterium]|nr:PAS domain-containing sensor histidine kinase [Thermoanaerobaculia bacterium]
MSCDPARLLTLWEQQSREHAVLLLDAAGRIIHFNPGAEHIFEYTAGEVTGLPPDILFTPQDRANGIAAHEIEVATIDEPAEDDRWQQRKDGSRFWASGVLVGLRDDSGEIVGFAKVVRNRTALREQIETLKNQVQALNDLSKRRDTFLSTLAHELANPLGPLLNVISLIRQTVPASAELDYALGVIARQTDLLRRLVGDLLELARAGAGKIVLDTRPLALQGLLEETLDDCRHLAVERGHEVKLILPSGPLTVMGDAERLHQVFVNLLTNAAKYTHRGGAISVKATTEGDEAVVRFEDNGIGIPHDMLPRIFELFTQVDASRPMSEGGLGIGLALVKELVSLHGGSVQAASEGPGKGSEFSVRLPLLKSERADIDGDGK